MLIEYLRYGHRRTGQLLTAVKPKSTFESTSDSEECVPSDPVDPDAFNRTVNHDR